MNLLTELRIAKGWSMNQLAVESSVDVATVSRIESGLIDPRQSTLEKLSKALGVEPSVFFGKTDEYNQQQGGAA